MFSICFEGVKLEWFRGDPLTCANHLLNALSDTTKPTQHQNKTKKGKREILEVNVITHFQTLASNIIFSPAHILPEIPLNLLKQQ